MAVRSQDDGSNALGHWFDLFHEAVVEGVRDYYRNYGKWAVTHRPTTRRSLTRDHIVDRLRAGLADAPGAEIIPKHGTTLFGLVSQFLLKAHMLNKRMCISLNQTQHAIKFNENESQPSLPGEGFSETTALYLGYLPNITDPMNPTVYLVCPAGAEPSWFMEIRRSEGAAVVDIVDPRTDLDPEQLVEIPRDVERKKGDE